MNYIEFGIYTSSYYDSVSILVKLTEEKAIGLDIPMSVVFTEVSNEAVCDWLYSHLYDLDDAFIATADLITHPNTFEDYGFLGKVNDLILQNELIKFIDTYKS